MNKVERIKMLKAMEYIVRKVNDEEVFYDWLCGGIADGDIKFHDLSANEDDEERLDYYMDDETFSELMDLFLSVMEGAKKSGGLYADDVVSGNKKWEEMKKKE